nr:transcriptional regulator [Trueperella bernardiae]
MSTLRTYRRDGRLPEPDATIGLEPNVRHGWLPETVDDWQTNRPGRGARTDLKS